jgi:transcriptional regulator with XRE-family HTH domain
MSQIALADALSTKQPNISGIERGERGLTVQQLVRICRVLKTSPNDILGERSNDSTTPLRDRRLARQIRQLQALPKRKRQALLTTLDDFLKGAAA